MPALALLHHELCSRCYYACCVGVAAKAMATPRVLTPNDATSDDTTTIPRHMTSAGQNDPEAALRG